MGKSCFDGPEIMVAIRMNISEITSTEKVWLATGMIVHERQAYLVTVGETDLIFDSVAWARDQAQNNEQSAEAATTPEAQAMFASHARDLRRWADNDETYEGPPLLALSPPLAARAKLGHLRVVPHNFEAYMAVVMEHARPARHDIEPSFFFIAEPDGPEIYAIERQEQIIRYASPGVRAEVVPSVELNRLLLAAMRVFPMAAVKQQSSLPYAELTPKDLIVRATLAGLAMGIGIEGIEVTCSYQPNKKRAKSSSPPKPKPERRERKRPTAGKRTVTMNEKLDEDAASGSLPLP